MREDVNILTADFPRAFRGYSRMAVDDFIRQMGERIEEMQGYIDEKTEMTERLQNEVTWLQSQLTTFIEKEAAIANAAVSIEKRRVEVENELEIAREEAKLQTGQILADAQNDAETILAEARRNSDDIITRTQSACTAGEHKLTQLNAEYNDTAMRIRRTLEAHMALLPTADATLSELSASGMAVATSMDSVANEVADAA